MEYDSMRQLMQALADKAKLEVQQKRIDETTRMLAALYDKAVAYTNLIIVAGYACFFAVWRSIKSDLSKFELLASALSMCLSLMVFVFWEVSVMLYTSRNLGELQKAVQAPPSEFEHRLEQVKNLEAKRNVRVRRVWYIVLLFTIVPGLVGGTILLGSFIRQLLAML